MMNILILLSVVFIFESTQAWWLSDWLGWGNQAVNLYSDHIRGQDALKREEEYKKQMAQKDEQVKQLIDLTAQQDRQMAQQGTMIVERIFKSEELVNIKKQSLTYQQQQVCLKQEENKNSRQINTTIKEGLTPTKLEQASQVAIIASGTVHVVKSVGEFVNWINPNEETLARKKEASLKLKYMNAEEGFNKCFAYNRKSVKNADGVPVKCEEVFDALLAVVGHVEGQKLKEALKSWQ